MNRLAVKHLPKVYAALRAQYGAAADAVRKRGVLAAQGNLHGAIVDTNMAAVITALYLDAAKGAAKNFQITKKAFGEDPGFVSSVMNYFKKFLLNKVVLPITKTTQKEVNRILDQAIKEGWGVDEAVKRLENTELPQQRARVIVRTESVRSMNATQLFAADESLFETTKEWLTVHDNRRRHSHAAQDGQIRELEEAFDNGCKFPGDPDADAKEIIQCRCTLAYKAKRDSNGRLIRKQPTALPLTSRMSMTGGIST